MVMLAPRPNNPTVAAVLITMVGGTLTDEIAVSDFIARHAAPFTLPANRIAAAPLMGYPSREEALAAVPELLEEMRAFRTLFPVAAEWDAAIGALEAWAAQPAVVS